MTDQVIKNIRTILAQQEPMPSGYIADQKDYDASWASRQNKIVSYIEAGERNIAEIFGKYRNYWMSARWKVGELAEFVSAGQTIQVLARSGYVFYRNAVADAVINECRKDTKAVVELGSGLGESTFTIWLEGRLRAPTFHVCEISPSGRKVSRILASLDSRMKLKTHFFDYRRPSFDGIPSVDGHVTVFSTHSIEQVSEIPSELIEKICDLGTNVTALHFEPIGWQFAADGESEHVAAHRRRCIEMGYNKNFWSLLKQFEAQGKIEILIAEPYFFGFAYNPPCKLIWRKK
jgi:hypothetical protein